MDSAQADPLIGKRIREYEILEVLGRGGMGAVYLARHVLLDEERAIKVVQSRLAGNKDFVERFIREAKILTRLRNPHLVQFFEFGTYEEDVFFMVLEFLKGESVLHRIERMKRLPYLDAVKIVKEAAIGLHSAHLKGIVHRDVSPDNLLLVKDDNGNEITKVIDFGIARPGVEAAKGGTAVNVFMGKLEYSSPEQCGWIEEGETIDARSDIYSLGATLYHMLAGRPPFEAPTPQGYLLKHASETPKPVSDHLTERIPVALEHLIQKTLAKKARDRHSSMEELVVELDRITWASAPTSVDVAVSDVQPQQQPATAEFKPGYVFARRYQIEKKLGEGGMGAVYQAVDQILAVPVALKVVSSKILDNVGTLERFKREVILARKVAHPNVCRIYDIGESENVHYVSMELLPGETLADLVIDQGIMAPALAIKIMSQVLEALQEAHRVGIVHRDLKPQNIMVGAQHRAWIMDFGISISAEASRVTQTGVLVGTPHYMAPEQLEGKTIDHRADIYALGVILFQILTGKLPFEATTPVAVMYAHLFTAPPKPSDLVPGFSPQLEKVILRAMEKDPRKRYQNVGELLLALRALEDVAQTKPIAVAQKLISEKNYGKAIKMLSRLSHTDPQNDDWKRLLAQAVSARTRRDLKRVRLLIKKNNLLQAQLLLERITKANPRNVRVLKRVKKMESEVTQGQTVKVNTYLDEVKEAAEKKDWNSALISLGAATTLAPTDSRIAEWQKEIQKHLPPEVMPPTMVAPSLPEPTVVRPPILPARFPKWLLVAIPLLAFLAVGSILLLRERARPVGPPPVSSLAPVSINALPWAKIRVIPSTQIKLVLPDQELVTPCFLTLPEGEYTIELTNDGNPEPVLKKIRVRSGQPNYHHFQMPAYDPRMVMIQGGDAR